MSLAANCWVVGNFHEKAGECEVGFSSSLPSCEFLPLSRAASVATCVPIWVHHRRIAPLPSALFVELFAPVLVGVLNFNGCCHLGTELDFLCCQKRPFLADAAVTRTRRFTTKNQF